MALNGGGKEAVWLQRLMQEMGFKQPVPTTVYVDNQSPIL